MPLNHLSIRGRNPRNPHSRNSQNGACTSLRFHYDIAKSSTEFRYKVVPMARKLQQQAACLVKGCNRKQYSRGLCTTHNRTAADNVAKGKTTWEELESFGMALPTKRPGRKSPFSDQLLTAKAGLRTK